MTWWMTLAFGASLYILSPLAGRHSLVLTLAGVALMGVAALALVSRGRNSDSR
jgi:hypothetical protein